MKPTPAPDAPAHAAETAPQRPGPLSSRIGGGLAVVLVLAIALGATAWGWQATKRHAEQNTLARFEYRTDRIRGDIVKHLEDHEKALRNVAAVIGSSRRFDREQLRRYFAELGDTEHYPGREAMAFAPRILDSERGAHEASVRATGVADYGIIADGRREDYFPLAYVKVFGTSGVVRLGTDLGSDPAAREAMTLARDTGRTVMSAPLRLSKSEAAEDQIAALVVPVYADGGRAATPEARGAALQGFMLAMFAPMESAGSALGADAKVIGLRVHDANRAVFTCPELRRLLGEGFQPKLVRTSAIAYGQRTWGLEFVALPPFHAVLEDTKSDFVLIGGIILSALLAALVGAMANTRTRALAIARARTSELHAALTRSGDSETRMRAVVDHALDAIITIDESGIIHDFNPAAVAIFGYAANDVIGRPVSMLMPSPDRDRHDTYVQNYLRTGEAKIMGIGREVTGLRKDGSRFPLDLGISEMRIGERRLFCGIVRDITARRAAEETLSRNESKLRSYISQSLDGVLVVDGEGHYLEANPAAIDMLGFPESELLKLAIPDTLYPDPENLQAGAKHFQRVVETGRGEGEIALRRKDGTRVIADIRAVALGNERYLGLLRDVTERWHAERALQQERELLETRVAERTDVLTRTNRALEQEILERRRVEQELVAAREQALQAAEAKAGFLANMSHEIRTPMNAVIGTAALLEDTALDAEQREYVETIRISGGALLGIINDILDFSKIESGMLELDLQPVELAACVEEAIDMLASNAAEKNLELMYDFADDVPPWILGDTTRLRQVLINMLSNAVKFTERGEVCVTVSCMARAAGRLTVQFATRDTGIGIPADKMRRLFKAFSQADSSTTRKYGGTGLGLAISARLAQLMGGDTWAVSEEGRGSTFYFTIDTEVAAARGLHRHLTARMPELAGKQVLVVDDNATHLHILDGLCRSWGLDVTTAADGKGALALLRQGADFDCALIDALMPPIAGIELAAEIRRLHPGTRPALVLLSPSASRHGAANSDTPFSAQLTKPIRHAALFEILLSLLAGTRAPAPAGTPNHYDRTPGNRRPLRVLVAEDSAINQKLAVRVLEKLGYAADIAATGVEVLDMVRRSRYDLVFMDLQMPEMDGLEAAKRIVAEWPPQHRPWMIAMTANALPGTREKCLAAGMDDYIAKPVLPGEMQRAIERLAAPAVAAGLVEPDGRLIDARTLRELGDLDESGKPSLLRALIEDYLAEAPLHIGEIREAAARPETAGIAAKAHKLSGISLSLGASGVADVCIRIEKLARTGDATALGPLIDQLELRFAKTRTHFAGLL